MEEKVSCGIDTVLSDMLLPLIPSDFISATGNIASAKAG